MVLHFLQVCGEWLTGIVHDLDDRQFAPGRSLPTGGRCLLGSGRRLDDTLPYGPFRGHFYRNLTGRSRLI